MLKNERVEFGKSIILFITAFSAGLINSTNYFYFLGLHGLYNIIRITYYFLLFSMFFTLLLKKLLTRNIFIPSTFRYWIVMLIAILLKLYILFVQNPSWVIPGGKYFYDFFIILTLLFTMILFSEVLVSFKGIKTVIYGLGLGAAFSTIIPFLFFPEMIGTRSSIYQGHKFIGGVWNPSVISYISVGWLLVSLSTLERSKVKKYILISLFLIMLLGGFAGLSRATLLSAITSISVYLLFAKSLKKYIKVILFAVIFFLLIINIFPEIFLNFSERLDNGIDIQEEARTEIWVDYLEDLPTYFLFGAIDGNYTKYSSLSYAPHSIILNWLTRYGIIGLLGFVILIIGLISSAKKIKKTFSNETAATIYAWLAAYLSVALVNETGFDELTVFVAFGIILAWGRVSEKV